VTGKLNKRRAGAVLQQARLLIDTEAYQRALDALDPVVKQNPLGTSDAASLYAEALERMNRRPEARVFLEQQLQKHRDDPMLTVRLGMVLLHANESRRAVELMSRVRNQLRRDPTFQTNFAAGLVRVGRVQEAEQALAAALLTGGGDDTRLVLAMAKLSRGEASSAEAIAIQVGTTTKDENLRASARAIEADCRLVQGDPKGALERFRALDRDGRLEPLHFPHAALAAQLGGDEAQATALMNRIGDAATSEDRLLFAEVFLTRSRPLEALAQLELAERTPGERLAGHEYEALVARGRTYRMLGRVDEAQTAIDRAKALPQAELPLVGGRVWLEIGHLAAERGDFELADASFTRALELDPFEPEAKLAKGSSSKRLSWKAELKTSAEARLAAAQSEAEAMKRRFLAREVELEAMRKELERLKHASKDAESRAKQLEHSAEAVKAQQAQRVREELEARDQDVDQKAREIVERALGAARERCPETLWRMVLVAEKTYQQGLYAELPAAAVAVLFSGALERSLFLVVVQRFDEWLERTGQRHDFLKGAVRERRGKRVEYFDRFVEAFDRTLDAKAPSLGEVARAITRRNEGPLGAFAEFLGEAGYGEAFLTALATFVQTAKERLRDPVAHGLAIDLSWDELKAFRESFLISFDGRGGVLAQLLGA
jgi:tetratricopeptide (TPR) repeat protein